MSLDSDPPTPRLRSSAKELGHEGPRVWRLLPVSIHCPDSRITTRPWRGAKEASRTCSGLDFQSHPHLRLPNVHRPWTKMRSSGLSLLISDICQAYIPPPPLLSLGADRRWLTWQFACMAVEPSASSVYESSRGARSCIEVDHRGEFRTPRSMGNARTPGDQESRSPGRICSKLCLASMAYVRLVASAAPSGCLLSLVVRQATKAPLVLPAPRHLVSSRPLRGRIPSNFFLQSSHACIHTAAAPAFTGRRSSLAHVAIRVHGCRAISIISVRVFEVMVTNAAFLVSKKKSNGSGSGLVAGRADVLVWVCFVCTILLQRRKVLHRGGSSWRVPNATIHGQCTHSRRPGVQESRTNLQQTLLGVDGVCPARGICGPQWLSTIAGSPSSNQSPASVTRSTPPRLEQAIERPNPQQLLPSKFTCMYVSLNLGT
nr:hypothetical protein CFP56_53234 [Quercus suber]